jgi:hypothetical protein
MRAHATCALSAKMFILCLVIYHHQVEYCD